MTITSCWKLLVVGAAAVTLSGYVAPIYAALNTSATPESMRTKTAEHFGVSERSVRIGDFKKNPLSTQYKARVNGTLYNCNFYAGAVNCARPGSGQLGT